MGNYDDAQGHRRRRRNRGPARRDRAAGLRARRQGDPALLLSRAARIAGNCRMCLVEVEPGPPKPQASCALPAADNQEILTDTPMVRKAREGVMEFLLINHPLDCPICDQGGECDLQDQAMAYGRGALALRREQARGRREIHGSGGQDVMTRCIQCTRCMRFSEEVAGVDEIGVLYRGEDMRDHHLPRAGAVRSELSGNVDDVCPVGALLRSRNSSRRGRGSSQGAGHRRHGRGRLEHPPRRPPARGDARASPHQRGRQRGVGQRQDPPPCRRAPPQPARPALGARKGQAAPASWDEALRASPSG